MAYETSNPPFLIIQAPGGVKIWGYVDGDAASTVDGSNYFTDGHALGMRDGDLIFTYATGSKLWSSHTVTVTTTTVDLADGTTVGSSTNSD